MRFRQVHLDFHTSPFIPEIGKNFDKKQWQETLKKAEVDSITLFATCHHGCAYYNTKFGNRHPHLEFDLLRAQMDACHEIGIATPVYLTGGANDWFFNLHPEWSYRSPYYQNNSPLEPAFKRMCFNSPYLDLLCGQIREVVENYPDANGIFLDIILREECCCANCVKSMLEEGLDAQNPADRKAFAERIFMEYYRRTTETAKSVNPDMPVFHNSGHVSINDHGILPYFSHLELESLPTGGWGYDHYPMSAAYCRNLGKEYLGMTGKFHTCWGEFGGLKSPEALRYECAAMLAQGSKCSIGDQLHPSGKLDESTYEIIGSAYREVKAKEPWCENAVSAAKLAILSSVLPERPVWREMPGDSGASRILLESHIPFDIVDFSMDWSRYSYLLLADDVRITPELAQKVETFRANGGKLIFSNKSGMDFDGKAFLLKDLPFAHEGESPFTPDYIKVESDLVPEYVKTPFVMYQNGERIKALDGKSLGKVYDPYFNRTYAHYSSHQHTPYIDEPTQYDCGVMTADMLYFSHPVFSSYRSYGAVVLKGFIAGAIRKFMGDDLQIVTTMPSQGRMTLTKQTDRYVLHALYANTILRGGKVDMGNWNFVGRDPIEIIDELNPSPAVRCSLKLDQPVLSVRIVPENIDLPFRNENGRVEFEIPSFICHRMIELQI